MTYAPKDPEARRRYFKRNIASSKRILARKRKR